MASEILQALLRVNVVVGLAILLTLAARAPVRRIAGPQAAYALWLIAPVAALASLLPPPRIFSFVEAAGPGAGGAAPGPEPTPCVDCGLAATTAWDVSPAPIAVSIWLVGAVLGVAWLVWRQQRFLRTIGRLARRGEVLQALESSMGPAVVGVLRPRIIVPADFEARFSPVEQEVVIAHERGHLRRGDAQINALVALAQCLCWFNPLVHAAAGVLRMDQELACDASVVAKFPKARRAYAEAMLKTQFAPEALPLGCYWPPLRSSALKLRLSLLKAPTPARWRAALGAGAALLLSVSSGYAAWAAQKPRVVLVQKAVPQSAAITEAAFAQSQRQPPRPEPPDIREPSVEPGKAVELIATRVGDDGFRVRSQLRYEAGKTYGVGDQTRQGGFLLNTSVVQRGEQVQVFAILLKDGEQIGRGSTTVRSGSTGNILRLDNGDRLVVEARVVDHPGSSAVLPETTPASEQPARATTREALLGEVGKAAQTLGLMRRGHESAPFSEAEIQAERELEEKRAQLAALEARLAPEGGGAPPPRFRREPAELALGTEVVLDTSLAVPTGRTIGGTMTYRAGEASTSGSYRGDRRYGLFTTVRQVGDKIEITTKLSLDGQPLASGTALAASGETVMVPLDNGMAVKATPVIRPTG